MPAFPRPFAAKAESGGHRLRWIVLIVAALAAVAWRTQSAISTAPRRLRAAIGGPGGGDAAGLAAPQTPVWSPEATQQDRVTNETVGPGRQTPPAPDQPVPDDSVPAQPAATQPEGGVPAPQAGGGTPPATSTMEGAPPAGGGSASTGASAQPPEIAPSAANQAGVAATGAAPAAEARPTGAASPPGMTQPGAAPETTAAGEDERGTFRPTKAETDDFGTVVVDDAPAGLAGDERWVRGDGSHDCPEAYPIKGNASSRIFHVPGSSSYAQTIPELCFATEEDAVAAGYRPRAR